MTIQAPWVPSAEAEAASALLFRTLGAHRAAVAALKPRPRPRLRASPDGDPIQDRCQATLVRLLSITEAFASDMLSREVDRAVADARSATATKVADEAVIRGTSSWRDQKRSYKDWLGIDESWQAVERLAEARNAVAHGLGKLTRRQLRNEQSVKSKLKAAGIKVDDNKIVLSDDSLAAAASACRELIERLDLAVQAKAQLQAHAPAPSRVSRAHAPMSAVAPRQASTETERGPLAEETAGRRPAAGSL